MEKWGRDSGIEPDAAWQEFVQLAVVRFTHCFEAATQSVIDMELSTPPLDVLMAWHSFMLSPHVYVKFCNAARRDGAGSRGIYWP